MRIFFTSCLKLSLDCCKALQYMHSITITITFILSNAFSIINYYLNLLLFMFISDNVDFCYHFTIVIIMEARIAQSI
jgi:hypothetical protein